MQQILASRPFGNFSGDVHSAKDLKNPLRRIKLVNDFLQTGYSPALPNSLINALSFYLNNYNTSG